MQSISPETIFRGYDAWQKSLPQIIKLTKRPLVLGRGINTHKLRNKIFNDLKNKNLDVNFANLKFDCCYEDISRVKNIILKNKNINKYQRFIRATEKSLKIIYRNIE